MPRPGWKPGTSLLSVVTATPSCSFPLSRYRYTKLLVLTLLLRRHWVIILWLGENEETSLFANWVNKTIDTQTPTHIGCNPHSALPWRRGLVSGGVSEMVLLLQADTVGAGEHLRFSETSPRAILLRSGCQHVLVYHLRAPSLLSGPDDPRWHSLETSIYIDLEWCGKEK